MDLIGELMSDLVRRSLQGEMEIKRKRRGQGFLKVE
jgi:hypothetical protein